MCKTNELSSNWGLLNNNNKCLIFFPRVKSCTRKMAMIWFSILNFFFLYLSFNDAGLPCLPFTLCLCASSSNNFLSYLPAAVRWLKINVNGFLIIIIIDYVYLRKIEELHDLKCGTILLVVAIRHFFIRLALHLFTDLICLFSFVADRIVHP